jgi:hypothetical protein
MKASSMTISFKRLLPMTLAAALCAGTALAEVRLLMVEQAGCVWCARWNTEIGPIYPKTSEGRIAPLERADLRGPDLNRYTLTSKPFFTPTFILIDDDVEVARLEGYAGDEFFWSLNDAMIDKRPPEKQKDPGS